MNLSVDQAIVMMDEFWKKRDLIGLQKLASAVSLQNPQTPEAWRYLGIHGILVGVVGAVQNLRKAAFMEDIESEIWLGVLNQFSLHPKGTLNPDELVNQVDFEKLRRSSYMDYPLEVAIETQAVCNAKCSFCPYPTMDRKGDKMSDALIEKILIDLQEIPPNLFFTISPFKVSDPFLDKRIFQICEKINKNLPNAKLRLFTNGSPLTERMIEKISLIKNVTHLWVSLNESNSLDYEKVMGLPFFKTIEKLDELHEHASKGFSHEVTISRVSDGSQKDQDFCDFVKKRFPLFEVLLIGRSDWTGQVKIELNRKVAQTACARWYELSIMASGKVALCCMDGEGKYVIGDVNRQSVLEVYNDPQFKKMRQYTFTRLAAASPCNTCST